MPGAKTPSLRFAFTAREDTVVAFRKAHLDMYRNLFNVTKALVSKLEAVLPDERHRALIAYGQANNYDMPDQDAFAERLADFRLFVLSMDRMDSDDHVDSVTSDGERTVVMPSEDVKLLQVLLEKSQGFVDHIRDSFYLTGYGRMLADLKSAGRHITGPMPPGKSTRWPRSSA